MPVLTATGLDELDPPLPVAPEPPDDETGFELAVEVASPVRPELLELEVALASPLLPDRAVGDTWEPAPPPLAPPAAPMPTDPPPTTGAAATSATPPDPTRPPATLVPAGSGVAEDENPVTPELESTVEAAEPTPPPIATSVGVATGLDDRPATAGEGEGDAEETDETAAPGAMPWAEAVPPKVVPIQSEPMAVAIAIPVLVILCPMTNIFVSTPSVAARRATAHPSGLKPRRSPTRRTARWSGWASEPNVIASSVAARS